MRKSLIVAQSVSYDKLGKYYIEKVKKQVVRNLFIFNRLSKKRKLGIKNA